MVEPETKATTVEQRAAPAGMFSGRDQIILGAAVVLTIATALLHVLGAGEVVQFVIAGGTLAALAGLVGQGTDQVGQRLGAGATGVLQSALGNLPELFVSIFALRAGLVGVVQAAIVGSILGNALFVLGLAFLIGGLKHGTQRFAVAPVRTISSLMMLAVAALAVPTLAHGLHTPAGIHANALSDACAIVLLVVFIASIPVSLQGDPETTVTAREEPGEILWPMWLAVGLLAAAGLGSAFVSDWFVDALRPAMDSLGLSEAFTGLVVVAIASNAVENVVGVQFAARNQPDFAISVILNSSLQVALGLAPILVLLSYVIGGSQLTLVMPALLVAALGMAAILGAYIVSDGESTWLEGLALMGLYGIIAASFWWG